MEKYRGFYKQTIDKRVEILKDDQKLNPEYLKPLTKEDASWMVENAIEVFEVPLGVAPGFLIDGKTVHVPMATEESSVIAAASHGAKVIRENGGFKTRIEKRLMRGEIIFSDPQDAQSIKDFVENHKDRLIELANNTHPSIVKRGGGVRYFETRHLQDQDNEFFIVDVFMDTQEAMGANMLNTVLESLGNHLETKTNNPVLMAILSNLATESIVNARVELSFDTLKFGKTSAQNIEKASNLAKLDVYRCATHNKGIMNGIDAVVLASANDTRAVNAGIYTYSSLNGTPTPLATWFIENDKLIGEISIPLAVGSVGGAISVHPKAKLSKSIMQYDSVKDLMKIIASVGLAQNFAALNALTSDGIQKGHMALHAKNIAKTAGATDDNIDEVVKIMLHDNKINTQHAQTILKQLKDA